MTTIILREYAASHPVSSATRAVALRTEEDCLELRLLSANLPSGAVPALQIRWAEKQGWHIVANQRDDHDIVELLIPDDGGPIQIADL